MMELDALKFQLKQLHLPTMVAIFEEEAKKAVKLKMSYTEFLSKLVEEEYLARTDRSINQRIAKAKFPFIRTLEGFDFSFQPSLSPQQIKELGNLSFLDKAENILFIGDQGTGKTHLAVALAIRATQARKRVLFFPMPELLEQLVAAQVMGSLSKKLLELSRLDLLVIDELGHLPIAKEQAHLFFQLVAKRYERGSIILTTNQEFDDWGTALGGDKGVATALLDRLIHHSHIIPINGPSWRAKDKEQALKKKMLRAKPSESDPHNQQQS